MQKKLELYQLVTPLAGLGIWERNLITGALYWNEIVRQILEVNDTFLPTQDESLKFYRNPKQIKRFIRKAIVSGRVEIAELELLTATGAVKWVRIRVQADHENGVCSRIYGTIEDITDNVKLVRSLKEKEQRFFQAFNNAPIGMALVSITGKWIKVNTSLCRLMGYTRQRFLKHTFQDFTHQEDLNADLAQMQQLLGGELESYSMEKRYFHADGHIIWALLSVSLVRDELNAPLYFISQIKDITEHKRSTAIIREQNSRLLNFAHIVSHNLRSHTGNIRMLTDMIFEEQEEAEKNNLIRMLNINAINLLETLDQLNEVVKVHDNGLNGRSTLSLYNEVLRVLDILAGSIRQTESVIDIDINPNIIIDYNPAYLESILINLISNSLKYKHPDRAPLIKISAKRNKDHVLFRIDDNGLGIDLKLHGHKLFGMYKTFHQHPDSRGMGLFLVKNQVEAMGGKIHAESLPGVGTAFTIEII